MNDLMKNLLVTLAVALVLMTVFKAFTPDFAAAKAETAYSTFLADVRANKISQVEFTEAAPGGVTALNFETTDGKSSWVTVGVGPNMIEASFEALVDALTFGLRAHQVAEIN